jgi:hypothetical protein
MLTFLGVKGLAPPALIRWTARRLGNRGRAGGLGLLDDRGVGGIRGKMTGGGGGGGKFEQYVVGA